MDNFPPKVEKFPLLQNIPIHVIFELFFFMNFRVSRKVEKYCDFSEKTSLCRMLQIMWFWICFLFFLIFSKWKIFHQSGKISTFSIWDGIWQTRRSRCRKKISQSGKISTKGGKIFTSAGCTNSWDSEIKFFYKWKKKSTPKILLGWISFFEIKKSLI